MRGEVTRAAAEQAEALVERGCARGYGELDDDCLSEPGEMHDYTSTRGPCAMAGRAVGRKQRLDDFPTGVLDLEAVRRMAEELGKSAHFLLWCTSGRVFAESLSESVPVPGPKSDLRPSFVTALLKAGVVEKAARRDDKKGAVAVFDVPKTDPCVRRIIVDGRPVNSRLPAPPKFRLTTPQELAGALAATGAVAAQVIDLKGYFHQFPLGDEVSNFFCVRSGQTWYRWRRLPMGFSYAPFIAQSTSEVFLGGLLDRGATVYLDDILVWGACEVEVRARAAYIRDRMACANGEVNERKSMQTPAGLVRYIGLEWDVPNASYRIPQDWRAEAQTRVEACLGARALPLHRWWGMLGLLFRVAHVHGLRLCYLCGSLQFMRAWARRVTSGDATWDTECGYPEGARQEAQGMILRFLGSEEWLPPPVPPPRRFSVAIWSDASTTGWGYVSTEAGDGASRARWGQWAAPQESAEMFHLELWAARRAVTDAIHRGHRTVILFVDNDAVRLVLGKGHARTRWGNSMLREVTDALDQSGTQLEVRWITTEVMPADGWSRKQSAGAAEVPLCSLGVRAEGARIVEAA